MSVFNMSPEEKQKILDEHKKAIKAEDNKKTETKEEFLPKVGYPGAY